MFIEYGKLSKAEVLMVLYNSAKTQGMGIFSYQIGQMTLEQAKNLLDKQKYFDYLKGRVMKVDLSNDDGFESGLYDRDNGEGAAKKYLDEYIDKKSKKESTEYKSI